MASARSTPTTNVGALWAVTIVIVGVVGVAGLGTGVAAAAGNNGGTGNTGTGTGNVPVADFTDTSPLSAQQTDPSSLSGKIRVESRFADATTVTRVENTQGNTTFEFTVTDPNASNVTFYVQTQAVGASQNVSGVTMLLDGMEDAFVVKNAGPGNSPWVAFVIENFSTRTVTFVGQVDDFESAPADTNADGHLDDVNADGSFTIADVQALFVNRNDAAVTTNGPKFDFNGDGRFSIADVQSLFRTR